MKSSLALSDCLRMFTVVLLSVGAGAINGFVGAGSGIIFMLLWSIAGTADRDAKSRYSFAMSCVLIVSLISLFLYPKEASSDLPLFTMILAVIAGVLGGAFGAFVKDKIKTRWLNLAFAALTLYSGISMVLRG